MNLFRVCGLVLCLAFALPACARECAPRLRDGWIRLTPVKMPMMAGFGRIENRCPTPMIIVEARSPSFGDVSLHETRIVDGVSRMRELPELRIASDGTAVLEPGGMHLMLMQPKTPLEQGRRIPIEFVLKDGRVLRGELEVRKAAP